MKNKLVLLLKDGSLAIVRGEIKTEFDGYFLKLRIRGENFDSYWRRNDPRLFGAKLPTAKP